VRVRLADAGTSTALVFGAHFARLLRPELHTTAQRTYDQRLALANSWHEQGLNRYAVIPRSALFWTDKLLAPCAVPPAAVPGCWLKSHVTENARASQAPGCSRCIVTSSIGCRWHRQRCRRRLRLLSFQGGTSGVFHAAAAWS
jgi:hypothetical protein